MGTSGSYPGPSGTNPLIPDWLDPLPADGSQHPDHDNEGGPNDQPDPDGQGSPQQSDRSPTSDGQPVPPSAAARNGFAGSKGNFSRFAGSGGGNRQALGRAFSGYVSRTAGGSQNATRRMGASRSAAGRLLGFLADAQTRGVAEALKTLNLGELVGKSADEIFFGLADYICPTEGTVDAGIARDSYTETIIDVMEAGVESLETLSEAQVGIVFESFLTNSIFERLCADVGAGLVQLSKDHRQAASVQAQIKDFIKGAVHDALDKRLGDARSISKEDANRVASDMYRQAFSILASYGEERGGQS